MPRSRNRLVAGVPKQHREALQIPGNEALQIPRKQSFVRLCGLESLNFNSMQWVRTVEFAKCGGSWSRRESRTSRAMRLSRPVIVLAEEVLAPTSSYGYSCRAQAFADANAVIERLPAQIKDQTLCHCSKFSRRHQGQTSRQCGSRIVSQWVQNHVDSQPS